MAKQHEQKKMGCLHRLFHGIFQFIKGVLIFFGLLLVIGFVIGDSEKSDKVVESPAPTETFTHTIVKETTTAPTPTLKETPPASPTKEPVEIILKYPELGQYGVYYTFNENVEKAEESDKTTKLQCYVPAGNYTLINEGKYPAFVFIYSKETRITSSGWEEPVDCWASNMLQVGDSCEISVAENYYINLQQNNVFKLIKQ